jgi:protein-S-isoprenylcysteine O-methyltransferase Ste14
MTDKGVEWPINIKMSQSALYKYVRNPMDGSRFVILLTAGGLWTCGRLYHTVIIVSYICLQNIIEERRMEKHVKGYKEYKASTGRFFPKLFGHKKAE